MSAIDRAESGSGVLVGAGVGVLMGVGIGVPVGLGVGVGVLVGVGIGVLVGLGVGVGVLVGVGVGVLVGLGVGVGVGSRIMNWVLSSVLPNSVRRRTVAIPYPHAFSTSGTPTFTSMIHLELRPVQSGLTWRLEVCWRCTLRSGGDSHVTVSTALLPQSNTGSVADNSPSGTGVGVLVGQGVGVSVAVGVGVYVGVGTGEWVGVGGFGTAVSVGMASTVACTMA